jgi:DNA-binding response OmpR family regulator
MKLLVVEGGGSGLQTATDRHLRLVVVDDHLPDLDAAGVVKELRDAVIATETPIMVLGHGTEPRHRARFLWAGATAYHCKPLNVAEVNRSVATLGRRHSPMKRMIWRMSDRPGLALARGRERRG